MTRGTFEVLNKALEEFKIDTQYDTEDKAFLYQLKNNLAVFSAFKSYRQTGEIVTALTDEKGKVKTWNQFKQDAQKINSIYNSEWLRTEFNVAQRQARSAEQWRRFERDKEIYPNLEYMPSRAAKQRDSHKTWYGIIKAIDDPFWDSALPPNGWNCKCWVRQSNQQASKEEITPPPSIVGIAGNAGKQAKIFTGQHPYVATLDKKQKKEVEQELKRLNIPTAQELLKKRLEFESFSKEYEKTYFDDLTGGYVVTHEHHQFDKNKGKFEKEAVIHLANSGKAIQLEKEGNQKGETPINGKKFSEGFLNGLSFELASVETGTKNNIKRGIFHSASKKVNIGVIYYSKKGIYNADNLFNGINAFRGVSNYLFEEFYIIFNDGKVKKVTF